MRLTQGEVVPYLLGRGLVSPEAVVEGDLAVADASRRNRNFHVISERGPCYLLKQGIGPDGAVTVAREAAVYRVLQSPNRSRGLERYLLRCHGYDPDDKILILESFPALQTLSDHHARCGRFSSGLAGTLGRALGALHRLKVGAGDVVGDGFEKRSGAGDDFAGHAPGVLSIHRPGLASLRYTSSANLELTKMVQGSSDLCRHLDELRNGWSPQALIHHDVKWENCLLAKGPGASELRADGGRSGVASRRRSVLRIVDWELAGVGDPSWDVGSVFSSYLSFWLLSIPLTPGTPPESFLKLARYPLEKMQPAIRSFWRSYVECSGLDAAASGRSLVRAVRYGAARLVQTGFEQMQEAAELTAAAGYLLQLCLNILRRPWEASVQLLGIPFGEPVAEGGR